MPNRAKPSGVRRSHERLVGWLVLDRASRRGKPPAWPLSKPSTAELKKWATLWKLPQSVVWRDAGCEDTVALYARVFVKISGANPSPKLMAEWRALDAKLGISPRAMHNLKWVVRDLPRLLRPNDKQVAGEYRASVTELRSRVHAVDEGDS